MFDRIKERLAARRWMKSPYGDALQRHGHSYFWADDAPFGHFEEANKLENAQALHGEAMQILSSENPLLANRQRLADYVVTFADFMAAGMSEEGKRDHELYAASPYISGELRAHIREISNHLDDLGRFVFEEPDMSDEELAYFCTSKASIILFFANGLNMLSIQIENRLKQKSEWYRAYVQAALVSAEDNLRRELGLESLLPGPVHGLMYASFTDFVVSGDPDPFYSWTKAYPELYLWGRGPTPTE